MFSININYTYIILLCLTLKVTFILSARNYSMLTKNEPKTVYVYVGTLFEVTSYIENADVEESYFYIKFLDENDVVLSNITQIDIIKTESGKPNRTRIIESEFGKIELSGELYEDFIFRDNAIGIRLYDDTILKYKKPTTWFKDKDGYIIWKVQFQTNSNNRQISFLNNQLATAEDIVETCHGNLTMDDNVIGTVIGREDSPAYILCRDSIIKISLSINVLSDSVAISFFANVLEFNALVINYDKIGDFYYNVTFTWKRDNDDVYYYTNTTTLYFGFRLLVYLQDDMIYIGGNKSENKVGRFKLPSGSYENKDGEPVWSLRFFAKVNEYVNAFPENPELTESEVSPAPIVTEVPEKTTVSNRETIPEETTVSEAEPFVPTVDIFPNNVTTFFVYVNDTNKFAMLDINVIENQMENIKVRFLDTNNIASTLNITINATYDFRSIEYVTSYGSITPVIPLIGFILIKDKSNSSLLSVLTKYNEISLDSPKSFFKDIHGKEVFKIEASSTKLPQRIELPNATLADPEDVVETSAEISPLTPIKVFLVFKDVFKLDINFVDQKKGTGNLNFDILDVKNNVISDLKFTFIMDDQRTDATCVTRWGTVNANFSKRNSVTFELSNGNARFSSTGTNVRFLIPKTFYETQDGDIVWKMKISSSKFKYNLQFHTSYLINENKVVTQKQKPIEPIHPPQHVLSGCKSTFDLLIILLLLIFLLTF